MYDAKLKNGWNRYDTSMVITSGVKRIESLWVKSDCIQQNLFTFEYGIE